MRTTSRPPAQTLGQRIRVFAIMTAFLLVNHFEKGVAEFLGCNTRLAILAILVSLQGDVVLQPELGNNMSCYQDQV